MFTGINLNCSINFVNTSDLGIFFRRKKCELCGSVEFVSPRGRMKQPVYISWSEMALWLIFDMGVSLAPKTVFCPYWVRTFRLLLLECIFSPLFFVAPLQVFVCLLSFCSTVVPHLCSVQYSFFLYKPIYPVTKRTLLFHPIISFLGFDNC